MRGLASQIRTLTDRLAVCARGNVAVLFAVSLPVIVGGGALGVETGFWYFDQYRIQQAADAAAYAAAVDDRAGGTAATMQTAALAAATSNGYAPATDTLTLHSPPTSGPNQNANSAEVILVRTEPRYFSQLFTSTPQLVQARAVATFTTAANACLLALSKKASQAVTFQGSTTVTLNGCNVMSDSIAADAIYSQGSSHLTAPCLMSVGGVSINANVTMTSCASAMTGLGVAADPFRNVAEPVQTVSADANADPLQPGRYTSGLTINKDITLAPGVYMIDGNSLKITGSPTITGTGVTIYLANNAGLSISGSPTFNLSAPTTGATAGILFFGSRSNTIGNTVKINGTAGSVLTGAIYFPAQPVQMNGDMQGANGCTQVVADTVVWSGNSTLAADCSMYGMGGIQVGGVVNLAE